MILALLSGPYSKVRGYFSSPFKILYCIVSVTAVDNKSPPNLVASYHRKLLFYMCLHWCDGFTEWPGLVMHLWSDFWELAGLRRPGLDLLDSVQIYMVPHGPCLSSLVSHCGQGSKRDSRSEYLTLRQVTRSDQIQR